MKCEDKNICDFIINDLTNTLSRKLFNYENK